MAIKKSKSRKKAAKKVKKPVPKKAPRKAKKKEAKRAKKKKAMEKVATKVMKVDKKLVEWRKALMAPAERAMIDFFLYPLAKNRGEKEAAKKVMMESYIRGDEVVKQFILFLAHEQLSRAAGIKTMHNFGHYRKMMGKEMNPGEVRKAVYRTIFNYTTSLEGLTELIEFIGELGDAGAAKLLSYHLSYYSAMEAPALQVLRNATIDSLRECNSPYALDALLSYAKYGEKNDRALYALKKWDDKLDKIEMGTEEKKFYEKKIAELFTSGKEKHEYYR